MFPTPNILIRWYVAVPSFVRALDVLLYKYFIFLLPKSVYSLVNVSVIKIYGGYLDFGTSSPFSSILYGFSPSFIASAISLPLKGTVNEFTIPTALSPLKSPRLIVNLETLDRSSAFPIRGFNPFLNVLS